MSENGIRTFRIHVPDDDIDELTARLQRTRWTDELPGSRSDYGINLQRVQSLAAYWRSGYDWRAWEARLNAYPQFSTEIDGQHIQFLHVRSSEPGALPLVLTHGWPGSIVEYLRVIDALTNPRARGDDPADAFDVVIPSLPGFGFSGPTTQAGWGNVRTAKAWTQLMARLGYARYGAAGNDAGSMISPEIGRADPDRVLGVHVTQIYSFPTGDPAELEGMTDDELAGMRTLQWFWDKKGAFNVLHSQQPQTLAHSLADSPIGLLAWHDQLLGDGLDDDFVLTNAAIYWFTNTAGSAIRSYYENANAPRITEPTRVPLGLCAAGDGDFMSIRRFAERDHCSIVAWNVNPQVHGHYAAHQHPDLIVKDLRAFFRPLR